MPLRFTELSNGLPTSVPFVGPETQERAAGAPFMARLGANENIFGPSPNAITAMEKAASGVWMYADPESHDLRHGVADYCGVPVENVIIGEGIDCLLGYLVRLMIEPGDKVVTSAGAYPTFNYHVTGYGGALVTLPYLDDHEDADALLAKAEAIDAKLIYLANPDNPMGSWHGAETIRDICNKVPKDSLLILDEAYIEFSPDGTTAPLDIENENVIRLRTFSKAYGMAGARVGYGIASAGLISAFNKIRNHFGMCRISQAGALAAIKDTRYLADIVTKVEKSRQKITEISLANGLTTIPSATNFVTIDCGADGDFARKVLAGLLEQGIFARMPFVAPQDRCIRISTAPDRDIELFAAALPQALKAART